MHSFLIIGEHEKGIERQVGLLQKELGVKLMPFSVAKIEDIRDLEKFTRLSLSEKSAVVINNFSQVSVEAQNAFLKALEEPQENLYYILGANRLEGILPTIQSRCQVIEVTGSDKKVAGEVVDRAEEFLGMSVGEKFLVVSKIKGREEAIEYLEDLVWGNHVKLIKNPELVGLLESALEAIEAMRKNGNVNLHLTNFVVKTG